MKHAAGEATGKHPKFCLFYQSLEQGEIATLTDGVLKERIQAYQKLHKKLGHLMKDTGERIKKIWHSFMKSRTRDAVFMKDKGELINKKLEQLYEEPEKRLQEEVATLTDDGLKERILVYPKLLESHGQSMKDKGELIKRKLAQLYEEQDKRLQEEMAMFMDDVLKERIEAYQKLLESPGQFMKDKGQLITRQLAQLNEEQDKRLQGGIAAFMDDILKERVQVYQKLLESHGHFMKDKRGAH